MTSNEVSEKSRGIALGLAFLLGVLGVHRFYVGKVGTGVLMFLTGGGAAIWWIVDMVNVASGAFEDKQGRRLLHWGVEPASVSVSRPARLPPPELNRELNEIDAELQEVTDRLELAERRSSSERPPESS